MSFFKKKVLFIEQKNDQVGNIFERILLNTYFSEPYIKKLHNIKAIIRPCRKFENNSPICMRRENDPVTIPEILENIEESHGSFYYKKWIATPYNHYKNDCHWMVRVGCDDASVCIAIYGREMTDVCSIAIYWAIKND